MVIRSFSYRYDLLVENCHGQPTLIVEVKSKINTSSEWAAKLRRNIMAHGYLPQVPYFLIAFPDKFYLWVNETEADRVLNDRKPDYVINANSILKPYFDRPEIQSNRISGKSFELIIASWLEELIQSEKNLENIKKHQPWLIYSGLYADLVGGKVVYEVAI